MSQKNAKAAPVKAAAPVAKPKGVRSDRLPKRERKHDQDHHTVTAGRIDRGLKTSPFEVVSISNRTNRPMSTFHQTQKQADKAAYGRQGHHHSIRIINRSSLVDQTPANELVQAPETAALEAAA